MSKKKEKLDLDKVTLRDIAKWVHEHHLTLRIGIGGPALAASPLSPTESPKPPDPDGKPND